MRNVSEDGLHTNRMFFILLVILVSILRYFHCWEVWRAQSERYVKMHISFSFNFRGALKNITLCFRDIWHCSSLFLFCFWDLIFWSLHNFLIYIIFSFILILIIYWIDVFLLGGQHDNRSLLSHVTTRSLFIFLNVFVRFGL